LAASATFFQLAAFSFATAVAAFAFLAASLASFALASCASI